jgi:hypothetical protein
MCSYGHGQQCCATVPEYETNTVASRGAPNGEFAYATYFTAEVGDAAHDTFYGDVFQTTPYDGTNGCKFPGSTSFPGLPDAPTLAGAARWTLGRFVTPTSPSGGDPAPPNNYGQDEVGLRQGQVAKIRSRALNFGDVALPCSFLRYQTMNYDCGAGIPYAYTTNALQSIVNAASFTNIRGTAVDFFTY